jgi:hypothetical protein
VLLLDDDLVKLYNVLTAILAIVFGKNVECRNLTAEQILCHLIVNLFQIDSFDGDVMLIRFHFDAGIDVTGGALSN